jgi:hypothetical protein
LEDLAQHGIGNPVMAMMSYHAFKHQLLICEKALHVFRYLERIRQGAV